MLGIECCNCRTSRYFTIKLSKILNVLSWSNSNGVSISLSRERSHSVLRYQRRCGVLLHWSTSMKYRWWTLLNICRSILFKWNEYKKDHLKKVIDLSCDKKLQKMDFYLSQQCQTNQRYLKVKAIKILVGTLQHNRSVKQHIEEVGLCQAAAQNLYGLKILKAHVWTVYISVTFVR